MPGILSEFWRRLVRLFTRPPRDGRDVERFTLPDGSLVMVRPLVPEDAPMLAEALQQLSLESRYHRFLVPVERLTPAELKYLTCVDGADHIALGMAYCRSRRTTPQPIAVARSIRSKTDPEAAEVAIVVADEWQRRGVGQALLRRLSDRAWNAGVRRWTATILAENTGAFTLMDRVADLRERRPDGPLVEVVYALREPGKAAFGQD